ncbi:MAG: hypothetical protein AABX28_01805, partial [Nanoarchaeota archaeon]
EGGTERFTILKSGNVGIGTTGPLSKLSINGGLHVGGDSDAGDNNLVVDGTIKITGGNPETGKVLTSDVNGLASWQTPSATTQYWTPSGNNIYYNTGNVGIGTNPTINLAIGDSDTGLKWISDGNLAVYTNNVERLRVDSSGNVGIGTASIQTGYKLQVTGGGLLNDANTFTIRNIDAPSGSQSWGLIVSTSNGQFNIGKQTNNPAFGSLTSNYLVISPSGNVGIGIASPSEKLEVNGNVKASGIKFPDGTTQTSAGKTSLSCNVKTATPSGVVGTYIECDSGYIAMGGGGHCGTGDIVEASEPDSAWQKWYFQCKGAIVDIRVKCCKLQ